MAAAASGAHSSTASVEDVIDYFDKIRDGLTNARDGTAALPELLLCVRDDSRVEDVRAAVEDDGAPVNGEVGDVLTPLGLAALCNQQLMCSSLREWGASATAPAKDGVTAMHVASWGGSASTAELVRGDDAEAVRVTDARGLTPLHYAVAGANVEVIIYLLDNGASLAGADDVCSPLDLAEALATVGGGRTVSTISWRIAATILRAAAPPMSGPARKVPAAAEQQKALHKMAKEKSQVEAKLTKQKNKNDALVEKLNQLKDEMKERLQDMETVRAAAEAHDTMVDELKRQLATAKRERAEASAAAAAEAKSLKEQLEDRQRKLTGATEASAAAAVKAQSLKEQLEDRRRKLTEALAASREETTRREALEAKHARMTKDLEHQAEALKAEVIAIQERVQDALEQMRGPMDVVGRALPLLPADSLPPAGFGPAPTPEEEADSEEEGIGPGPPLDAVATSPDRRDDAAAASGAGGGGGAMPSVLDGMLMEAGRQLSGILLRAEHLLANKVKLQKAVDVGLHALGDDLSSILAECRRQRKWAETSAKLFNLDADRIFYQSKDCPALLHDPTCVSDPARAKLKLYSMPSVERTLKAGGDSCFASVHMGFLLSERGAKLARAAVAAHEASQGHGTVKDPRFVEWEMEHDWMRGAKPVAVKIHRRAESGKSAKQQRREAFSQLEFHGNEYVAQIQGQVPRLNIACTLGATDSDKDERVALLTEQGGACTRLPLKELAKAFPAGSDASRAEVLAKLRSMPALRNAALQLDDEPGAAAASRGAAVAPVSGQGLRFAEHLSCHSLVTAVGSDGRVSTLGSLFRASAHGPSAAAADAALIPVEAPADAAVTVFHSLQDVLAGVQESAQQMAEDSGLAGDQVREICGELADSMLYTPPEAGLDRDALFKVQLRALNLMSPPAEFNLQGRGNNEGGERANAMKWLLFPLLNRLQIMLEAVKGTREIFIGSATLQAHRTLSRSTSPSHRTLRSGSSRSSFGGDTASAVLGDVENGRPTITADASGASTIGSAASGAWRSGESTGGDCGMLHRDLKPPNLFLWVRLGRLAVKVGDLGSAKLTTILGDISAMLTAGERGVGTAWYVAPEIAEAVSNHSIGPKPYSTQSDVFSLGIIMMQVLGCCKYVWPTSLWGEHSFAVAAEILSSGRRPFVTDWPSEQFGVGVRGVDVEIVRDALVLASECMRAQPSDRPRIADIETRMEELVGRAEEAAAAAGIPVTGTDSDGSISDRLAPT